MSNQLGIVHPGLLTALRTRHYPATCTIEEASESRDAMGQVTMTWATLSGHASIKCSVASQREGREIHTGDLTYERSTHRIALAGSYTSITPDHRAVIGSTNYDIVRVHQDSQTQTTYLDCEIVT